MYESLKKRFTEQFGTKPGFVFSAPGRTEIGGNHTDHQHGCVLAGAVNLDTVAAVARSERGAIRVLSEGYPLCEVSLSELEAVPAEAGTTKALIRGIAARFAALGHAPVAFDAYVTSTVLPGSGLSSSAENVYFGKPCGLMDQTASAVGNIIGIDFADPAHPKIQPVAFDFASCGYSLCIIDSGASHSDLTDCYAAITNELKAVCSVFGKEALRDVPEDEFYARLGEVRQAAGDRAVLRAIHVYEDNKRVRLQLRALENDNFPAFLEYVKESGDSSWMYLQNVIPEGRTARQEVAFALALAKHLLGGHGACRVHGGGFAGTIQAFVPNEQLEEFRGGIEAVLGEGSCHVLSIRPEGGILAEVCSHD